MTGATRSILFLCTGNSARSILAEAVMNRLGEGRILGFSAGSHPTGTVHPLALDLLRREGHTVDGLRSKSWDEFAAPGRRPGDDSGTLTPTLDVVITVCDNAAGEICPVWPGGPVGAHWGLPDPAAAEGDDAPQRRAFAETLRALERRIGALVKLPLDSLDGPALRERLAEIDREARK